MTLDDLPAHEAFRAEARDWIRRNAPWDQLAQVKQLRFAGEPTAHAHEWLALARRWQLAKHRAGWACLVWPVEYGGRGLSPTENVIFQEEEGPFAELYGPFMIGQGFVAPTLMAYASEAQKRRFLPPLASGEAIWCQLFSEPGAGSDLAGVRLRAVPCEGGWRLQGQKVWTSGAQYSEWGIVLTRSDAEVPKHKGLTMFFVAMNAPGIKVRPIRQLSGASHFNEVFFDDVFVSDAQRLGGVGEGWRVALTTLTNERMTLGASTPVGFDELFELALREADNGRAASNRKTFACAWRVVCRSPACASACTAC
jgi:alkylation response protein AidB-like acyl-CoA dehydrogenase